MTGFLPTLLFHNFLGSRFSVSEIIFCRRKISGNRTNNPVIAKERSDCGNLDIPTVPDLRSLGDMVSEIIFRGKMISDTCESIRYQRLFSSPKIVSDTFLQETSPLGEDSPRWAPTSTTCGSSLEATCRAEVRPGE